MNRSTLNRVASEGVGRALDAILRFQNDNNYEWLEGAATDLEIARINDPDYFEALLYSGLVMDLLGRPADAVPFFQRIASEARDVELKIEAEFNLGVASYHQYSHSKLQEAESHFHYVISHSSRGVLRSLAMAHLTQTYAMWERPSRPQQLLLRDATLADNILRFIQGRFELAEGRYRGLHAERQEVAEYFAPDSGEDARLWQKVEATAENGMGMAYMYLWDYLGGRARNESHLTKAISHLLKAEVLLPGDWANTCDLGSVHLRLGVEARSAGGDPEPYFAKARHYLQRVVQSLRPNYGFAWYELGIVFRVAGDWEQAKKCLKNALKVPSRYRDISSDSVEDQLARVLAQDSSFPGSILGSDVPKQYGST